MEPMRTATMTPPSRHPFLDLVPEGSPEEQLRCLAGLGLHPEDLLAAARSLFNDEGEAILAVPLPFSTLLGRLPAEETEMALLGFTVQSILTSEAILADPRTAGWAEFPLTLHGLVQEEHSHVLQVLYLGTILTSPKDPRAWKRVSRVMKAVDHLGALGATSAPPVGPISGIYDSAHGVPSNHPYLFFKKEGF